MRFEDIPAGEARQLDGPFYGLKVLRASLSSRLAVDSVAWPADVLPSYAGVVERVIATGPLLLVLAESEDEDVRVMAAVVPPPQPGQLVRDVRGFAPGDTILTVFRDPAGTFGSLSIFLRTYGINLGVYPCYGWVTREDFSGNGLDYAAPSYSPDTVWDRLRQGDRSSIANFVTGSTGWRLQLLAQYGLHFQGGESNPCQWGSPPPYEVEVRVCEGVNHVAQAVPAGAWAKLIAVWSP